MIRSMFLVLAAAVAAAPYRMPLVPELVARTPQSTDMDQVGQLFATLPEATASHGAVAVGDWLYVYGGHIARTHLYTTDSVSGRFSRLNLNDPESWEELPGGPGLQGMNLAEHDGKVYRVGGMRPQNAPGDPQDMRSLSDVARFDPALGEWEAIPPLPAPRSSHDVVVVDDTLVVVGGWNMRGADSVWAETMAVMDLAAFALEWRTIPQPFERRALIAAVKDGLMCVLGGMNSAGAIERTVSIYDVTAGTWTRGPDLPEGATSGFSPAACVVDGDAYVSFADGGLYRMNQDQTRWIRVGTATPRVAHRLVPHGESLLVVVGADSGENSDLIEVVSIDR